MDFFVVGTSRSGSTLVRHMLAAHPGVVVLNESHWVPRMWQTFGPAFVPLDELMAIVAETRWDSGRRVVDVNLELAGRSWDELVARLRARLGESTSIAALHRQLVDEVFGATPDTLCRGDKTPDYGFYMSMLQAIWPRARFLHIVRNGIDTARSMSQHSGCQLQVSAGYDNWVPLSYGRRHEQYDRLDLPLDAYVRSWERRLARIRSEAARLYPGTYLEVRYERLIEDPAAVVGQMASHLAIEPLTTWLARCSSLVRRKTGGAPGADAFLGVSLPTLRTLNDVGGIQFLAFGPHARVGELEASLREPGDSERAVQMALSTLATRTAESHPELTAQALDLLRRTVVSRGGDASAWSMLQAGPHV